MNNAAKGTRILAFLLSVMMILAMMPFVTVSAYAEGEPSVSNCTIELEYYICTYDGTAKTPGVTVTSEDGTVQLVQDTDYTVTYGANTDTGWVSVTVTGTGAYMGSKTTYFEIKTAAEQQADRLFGISDKMRIAGKDRYDTSIRVADKLKKALGVDKFDNIVVAYGGNYPDALAGGYLAKVKNAPVITVDKTHEASVKRYIEDNLKEGGKVYILGGTGVVSAAFENSLKESEAMVIDVERLSGVNRYETNLRILEASGVDKEALLVCSGNGYADSLSASAVGLPILLVGTGLTAEQKAFLGNISSDHFYVIGGTGAVSASAENAVKAVATSTGSTRTSQRLAGATRYQTSTLVAQTFFEDEIDNVVLAYAKNFPDGLSGGPLAIAIGAPLILTDTASTAAAKAYVGSTWIDRVVTLGGTALISDAAVNNIMKY